MTDNDCLHAIRRHKKRLGDRLVILGHHYQCPDIISVADIIGDSFELSRRAAEQTTADTVVFCGVHFMAESAFLLSPPGRRVLLPDIEAGCPMADMATISQVERAWQQLEERLGPEPAIPVVYMNSSAAIKAFCGKHGGAVCTSSNAKVIVQWALDRGKRVFFLPDEHLGRNTGHSMGFAEERMALWTPHADNGGVFQEQLERAALILWRGFCIVHQRFTVADVESVRHSHPEASIYVHPECARAVVEAADAAGSTSFLVDAVRKAPTGAAFCIGTEVQLVDRLAAEHPDKHVFPLKRSICSNMAKITTAKLLQTIIEPTAAQQVHVDERLCADARVALQRMLDICA